MDRWASYLYIYGIGGMVFLAGLLVAWRAGALRRNRGWLAVLLAGMALYALGHAGLQLAGAPGPLPETGTARGAEGIVGTPLDLAVIAVYFLGIVGMGAFFARYTRSSSDFFFGGRRFSAWLVAVSCVATTVGSYSFLKYSSAGFRFGLSSSMTYLNDWFWMPLWMLVWLPIVYYGRIASVPEYFERRFGRPARVAATAILLIYLVGYIGINFLTLGKAIAALVDIPVFAAAALAAVATGIYVAVGGQTSVIMTDLAQGLLLLAVGIAIFVAGVLHVGGFAEFWSLLPPPHRMGLSALREPASFPAMGVFWQDAMAGGIAFYFMNQGILMRFMSARSVRHGRVAMAIVVLLIMPLAAVSVSGPGWAGRAMAEAGMLPRDIDPDNVFVFVSELVSTPGVFGLIMATLTAALMSTADTLLTAVSAVFVNDIWRPFLARDATDDAAALGMARFSTVATAAVALLLVPVFNAFDSIYVAHATFTAAVVPPMATALVIGAVWKRYSHRAALLTLVGGSLLIFLSVVFPDLVTPFAQGVDPGGVGLKAHKYMRACFGVSVSALLAVVGTFLFPRTAAEGEPSPLLVAGPEEDALTAFKGAAPKRAGARTLLTLAGRDEAVRVAPGGDEVLVRLHPEDRAALGVDAGDLLHVAAPGWWHGGLMSLHARVDAADAEAPGQLELARAVLRPSGLRDRRRVVVEVEG